MRTLAFATAPAGYFPLLQTSADHFGFDLEVLGWGQEWHGTSMRLTGYRDALRRLDPEETVMIVDAYDVVFAGPAADAAALFKGMRIPLLFSSQRYFPSNPWLRRLADRVMGLEDGALRKRLDAEPYGRPCMGGLIGHAAALAELFSSLVEIEGGAHSGHDQIPLNHYLRRHPEEARVDRGCQIFQPLWRTRGRFPLKGRIDPVDADAEVRIVSTGRVENRLTGSRPQMLHGPMDLDMNPLLTAMGYDLTGIHGVSSARYFRSSIRSYLGIFARQELAAAKRWLVWP